MPTTGVLPLAPTAAHTVMLLAADVGLVSFDDVSELITVSGFAGRWSGCATARNQAVFLGHSSVLGTLD